MNEQNDPTLDNDTLDPADDSAEVESASPDETGSDPASIDAATVSDDSSDDDGGDTDDDSGEGDLDIDAALASVASLSDVLAEEEAAAAAERERIEAEQRAAEEEARRRAEHYYPRPTMTPLQRGQMASVVPALALIAIGAWLTLTLTTSGSLPDPGLIIMAAATGTGLTLLAQWITSGRWARGALFGGLAILFTGGVIVYLIQDNGLGADGWPLLLVAPGVALLLTALLSQPGGSRMLFSGAALVTAGLVALAVTTGSIDTQITDAIESLWFVVLGFALALLVLPLLFRSGR